MKLSEVESIGAVVLEHRPRLNELDPSKLYIWHAYGGIGIGHDPKLAAQQAEEQIGQYLGWWGSRSATASSVDDLLRLLGYPLK